MVVVVLLLAALPAAAGQTAKPRGSAGWERVVAQVIAWLGRGLISPDYSSSIDPNGQH
jgi:cytochrome c oxidase assembly factor CtaG